jgi:hypothetical protein
VPDYHLHLRAEGAAEPVCEKFDALDDEEARGLAELRLLMTRGVAGVTVLRSGVEVLHLERDGAWPVGETAEPSPAWDGGVTDRKASL